MRRFGDAAHLPGSVRVDALPKEVALGRRVKQAAAIEYLGMVDITYVSLMEVEFRLVSE